MKKLIYLFLLTLLTACPSGGDKFNPGEKPPVNIPQPDTIEIPEKPIDTIIEKPGRDTIPESKPEKPKPKPIQSPVPELAETGETFLKISWISVGADAHKVYIRTKPGGWDNIYTIGNENNITINNLIPGTDYDILVQALKDNKKKNSKVFVFRTQDRAEEPEDPDTGESIIVNIQLPTDGSDVTKILQDQLDVIPNGTKENPTIVNFPEGRYNAEGTLVAKQRHASKIENKEWVIVNAENTTLYVKAPSVPWGGNVNAGTYSHRRQFGILNSKNITLNGLRVEGANKIAGELLGTSPEFTPEFWLGGPDTKGTDGFPAYVSYWEQEHAIEVINSEHTTLIETYSYGTFGDGIYVSGSKNTKLIGITTDMSGRQGIATSNLDGLTVDRSLVKKARRTAVDLETDKEGQVIQNIVIKNSSFESHLNVFGAGGPGEVSYVLIDNNEYSGKLAVYCRSNGLRVHRTNWTFTNNRRIGRYGGSDPVLKFGYTDNVLIEGNTENFSGKYLSGNIHCENMIVRNNNVPAGKKARIADFRNLEVYGNTPELEILDNTELVPVENRRDFKE